MGYFTPMSPQNTEADFVWVNREGLRYDQHEGLRVTDCYQAVPTPKSHFYLSPDLCCPESLAMDDQNKAPLLLATMYMAQSETGRAALATINQMEIYFGLDQTLSEGRSCTGSDGEGFYILLNPALKPDLQHLIIVNNVAQVTALDEIMQKITADLKEIPPIFARAATIAGFAALMDHVEECLDTKHKDPRRFVPPTLEQNLRMIFSDPGIRDLDIPKDRAERDRLRAHLIAAAQAIFTPLETFRSDHPRGPADPSGNEASPA